MYFTSPVSNITPALVSVAMSRSDSRDSNCSTTSTRSDHYTFSTAPMTVSYATSPVSYLTRTTSSTSTSSTRRASQCTQRRDSSSQWIASPYRSCQMQDYQEPSSFISDDDLLYIAPPTSYPKQRRELPVASIPTNAAHQRELTTEEQIALLRAQQEREQEQHGTAQQPRRYTASQAHKAVRFAEQQQQQQAKPRRPSTLRRRTTTVKRGMSQMGSQ